MTEIRSRRKEILEGLLRAIDVTVGMLAMVAGIFALAATPPTILREVTIPQLVWLWGGLLIVGGFAAALGRIIGLWIFETSGIAAMAFGTAIYAVVLSQVIHDELGVIVAAALITIALLLMARRYVQLQIFTSEPDERGWLSRVVTVLTRRTPPESVALTNS